MLRILSLDFDGVMHPSPRHVPRQELPVFVWLPHLERLLEPHPDVGLLVHSSWREVYRVDEIEDMLHPLENRFVGVAPPGDGGVAIGAWRQQHAPNAKVLVLDDDEGLQAHPYFSIVLCDPRLGLSDIAVQQAIAGWLAATPAT